MQLQVRKDMSVGSFSNFLQPQRGVEASAELLQRLYLAERETMRALGAWHIGLYALSL
jgi:hypothetical protein